MKKYGFELGYLVIITMERKHIIQYTSVGGFNPEVVENADRCLCGEGRKSIRVYTKNFVIIREVNSSGYIIAEKLLGAKNYKWVPFFEFTFPEKGRYSNTHENDMPDPILYAIFINNLYVSLD